MLYSLQYPDIRIVETFWKFSQHFSYVVVVFLLEDLVDLQINPYQELAVEQYKANHGRITPLFVSRAGSELQPAINC